jgi:hypothetical protein
LKPRTTISFAIVLLAWLFLRSPLWTVAPALLPLCALMAFLTLYPLWRWLGEGMASFPLMAAYALMHIPSYLVPFLEGRPDVIGYSPAVSAKTALAVCAYLFSFQVAGHWTGADPWGGARLNRLFLVRTIPSIRESVLMWFLLGIWWCFIMALNAGFLPDFGTSFQVVRVMAVTPGLLAAFYFFFLHGRRALNTLQKSILMGLVATGVAMDFTSGYLIGGGSMLLLVFLAYMMGSKRVPVLPLTGCLLLLSFLQLGKTDMRDKYWNMDEGIVYGAARLNPIEVYTFWGKASWQKLIGQSTQEEDTSESLLHRSAIAHMLALAISETPQNKPYLNGLTYKQIPRLLVPRMLWKDKPHGNLPTETLGIYYEVQTEQTLASTSIAFGQIAEAWANFGWIGIFVVGGMVGLVLSLPSHLSMGCSFNQVGFFLSAVVLASSYNLEMTLGPWLVSLFDALLVGSIGLYLISRPVDANRPTFSIGRKTARMANQRRTTGHRPETGARG